MKKLLMALISTALILQLSACTIKEPDTGSSQSEETTSSSDSVPGTDDSSQTSDPPDYTNSSEIWNILPEIGVTAEGDFKYSAFSDGIAVTDYIGGSDTVMIPEKIDGKSVVRVDLGKCEKPLKEIVLPDDTREFRLSEEIKETLEYINIPSAVGELDNDLFRKYTALKAVYIAWTGRSLHSNRW